MKFPKGLTTGQKIFLKNIYEDTFQDNLKKKGEKKAKAIARTKFYEESFKIFSEKENLKNIREQWEEKNKTKKNYSYIKEDKNIDYKVYKINNTKFIVSTDERILEKFSNADRKGLIKDMNDEFEQEILFKVKEKYGMKLHPDMYYAIK